MLNRKHLETRLSTLKTERASWDTLWKDSRDFILPEVGRWGIGETNKGSYKHGNIINGTATRSLHVLATGMQSGLTSPSKIWFRLSTEDEDMAEIDEVKQYLSECEKIMRSVFQRSNLYESTYSIYTELGGFGNAACAIVQDSKTVIRCVPFTIGEYYLALGADNRVNTVYREFTMTASQLVEAFGIDKVSTSAKNSYENDSSDAVFNVVHTVQPNIWQDEDKADNKNMPYLSVYYEPGCTEIGKEYLSISGFEEFPVLTPRWQILGKNTYGVSPTRDAIGSVKMLQRMESKTLEALDKQVNPPMVAPASMKAHGGATLLPGGITYIDPTDGSGQFVPAYTINPDWAGMQNKIGLVQQEIQQFYYNDLFFMIASAGKDMTATEVLKRQEEKIIMLSPVVERLQNELLNPLIDRTFRILGDMGLLPPAPEVLQGQNLKIKYVSLLAQAQEYLKDINGIRDVAAFAGNLIAVFPEVGDRFDSDEAVKQYANSVGADPDILRTDKEVEEIRTARAERQAKQDQAAEGQVQSSNAKTLSEANLSTDNALTRIMR